MMKAPVFLTTLTAIVALAHGASPAIGIAEGTQIHTALLPSQVRLQSGVEVSLSSRSAGTLYSDHVVLDEGSVRVGNFAGFTVDARQLQIQAEDPNAQAVVRLTNKTVEVASLGGNVNVTDGGAMLTRVTAGTRISFQQNASAGQTASAPGRKRLPSDQHTMIWLIGITAVAALAIGLTAAAQGKSPF
ncbi:MAG: hypothetical protein M3Y24_06410 [Acidobacteriota bacterium]|nr:hypothetical protein [Acidobacteriota bacterium]